MYSREEFLNYVRVQNEFRARYPDLARYIQGMNIPHQYCTNVETLKQFAEDKKACYSNPQKDLVKYGILKK